MIVWGETGTRKGATPYQVASAAWLFSRYGIAALHDGDCVGADEQLYHLGRAFGAKMVLHPPENYKFRAFCGDTKDEFWAEKSYMDRDKDVVNESQALAGIARTPYEEHERSGTWDTIRYARLLFRPIAIIWPNGHISYENWTLSHD